MTEVTLRSDEPERKPEDFARGRMKKVVQIQVEGVNLYSTRSLPVYEVGIGITVKGWKCTGPSRYRHVTERSQFKFQVSARDGQVLGWQAEKEPPSIACAVDSSDRRGDDSVDHGLLERTEQLLAELVGVG